MKGMRFPLHVILTALTLYFLNNSSTRIISQSLMINSGIKVFHVTITSWTNKFAHFFKQKADKFKACYKANNLIYLFIFHYNFIRPHGLLNNCTPAEVAVFTRHSLAKNSWFSAA